MAPADRDRSKVELWNNVKIVLDRFETMSQAGQAYAMTFHCASREANRNLLRQLAYKPERVFDLEEANFDKLFKFVHASLRMMAEVNVG